MPSSLNKVTKSISKKRQGKQGKSASLNALHENSRDAQRIRRAAARDDKVARQEKTRRERDGRMLSRMAFFHAALSLPSSSPDDEQQPPSLRQLIALFLSRHDAALREHVAGRRAGRPKTPAHVALEREVEAEREEYEAGFWTVDLSDEGNAKRFKRDWSGEWGGLGQFRFVRVRREGEGEQGVTESGFPPTAGL